MSSRPLFSLVGKRVWVGGHRGMVGAAIVRRLRRERCRILTVDRSEVDLRRPEEIERWMASARPDAVFLAAARAGGIHANDSRPAEFIYDNVMIAANVIEAARRFGVEKLLFLGTSCIYPKHATQPIEEEALLSGPLEPTNQWYAVAKIAGIRMCQAYRRQYGCDFIAAMPTNLYGPGDTFDVMASHVVPALIVKAHRAKVEGAPFITVWGSGTPRRELLYVDDAADAMVHLMTRYSDEPQINVGTGVDLTIAELARTICDAVGFRGELRYDSSMPDGTPRKLLDVSKALALGWRARTPLREGLDWTYRWYLEHVAERTARAAVGA